MSTKNSELASGVGEGSTPDVVTKYDRENGSYKDEVVAIPEEQRLPTVNMPKAPDPSPFTLGSMTPGGRSE